MHTRLQDFKSDAFLTLTPEERVLKCREMAADAEDLASIAEPQWRASHLDIARQWTALADDMERALAKPPTTG